MAERMNSTDTETMHEKLWEKWTNKKLYNRGCARDDLGLDSPQTEKYYGYIGLIRFFDAKATRVYMEAERSRGKLSDSVYLAIMQARGHGDLFSGAVSIAKYMDGGITK